MIIFPAPVTVTPPPIGTKTFQPIVLTELDYSVLYDNTLELAWVNIKVINRGMLIWGGSDYIAAGEFTDAKVDARVAQILGKNPGDILTGLYNGVHPYTPPKPTEQPKN